MHHIFNLKGVHEDPTNNRKVEVYCEACSASCAAKLTRHVSSHRFIVYDSDYSCRHKWSGALLCSMCVTGPNTFVSLYRHTFPTVSQSCSFHEYLTMHIFPGLGKERNKKPAFSQNWKHNIPIYVSFELANFGSPVATWRIIVAYKNTGRIWG